MKKVSLFVLKTHQYEEQISREVPEWEAKSQGTASSTTPK